VVVVGGGFAGLEVARRLARAPVDITLLDRTNHHTFQPLLYQVATAGLNPADIAAPIRRILRGQKNVTVLLADVLGIDVDARELRLEDDSRISYDYLVVATGVTHSYFGKDELAEFAPGLKTVDDGLSIRQRIFLAFEEAERSADDPKAVEAWLSFVVVGAGPTGVELAGALAEIARRTLPREFRRMNPAKARVLLLEGGDRVLPAYSAALSAKAERSLEKLGVEVRTRTRVEGVDAEGVDTDQGRIGARTVLWAAGVAGSPLARSLGVPLDRAGRVLVEPTLSIPGTTRSSSSAIWPTSSKTASSYQGSRLPRRRARASSPRTSWPRWRGAASALPLRRQRHDGDHRSRRSRRAHGQARALGARRLARVAVHPHPVLDRLQEQADRAHPVGLGLPALRPRLTPRARRRLVSFDRDARTVLARPNAEPAGGLSRGAQPAGGTSAPSSVRPFTARFARRRMSRWSDSSKLIALKQARASIFLPSPA
jgi:NADH dehydrogenase FAD-containing subunit